MLNSLVLFLASAFPFPLLYQTELRKEALKSHLLGQAEKLRLLSAAVSEATMAEEHIHP
jgi:hypothetical protein